MGWSDRNALPARAKRAYELGRLRRGLKAAAIVLPVTIASTLCCNAPLVTLIVGLGLAGVIVASAWRSDTLGSAARLGIDAGWPAFLLPALGGALWAGQGTIIGLLLCVLGGLAAGLMLARAVSARPLEGRALMVAMTSVTLFGALGCVYVGVIGLIALLFGQALAVGPAIALRRV